MRYKPKNGEVYYTITILSGRVQAVFFECTYDEHDQGRVKEHNCFKTKEEAEIAVAKILRVLKEV